ncbi:unannotated protein [freshwater metagenome]|uniref:Unannotated protein n=1 Tax=freshwater metagenome TaxID=449393 RepID=A0A6J7QDB3_9ZZZZ
MTLPAITTNAPSPQMFRTARARRCRGCHTCGTMAGREEDLPHER